ncbi:MAG: DUF2150 family protein [Halobacteriales archaeon]
MSAPAEGFYSEERWHNWIDRLMEEDLDPEDEDSARLLLNLQDDVAIAVAKIVRARDDGDIDDEVALEELSSIHETVSEDPGFDDEETEMLVGGVQMSLDVVFYAAQQYVAEGVADEADAEGYIRAAAEAEAEEDLDRAVGLIAAAGTRIIDGEEFAIEVAEELDPGYVTEWINGLDSLQSAMADPEVIEE